MVRGFCWSESSSPTVKDSKVEALDSTGENGYMLQLVGLKPSTEYYVRAYAKNVTKVAYGESLCE